MPVGVTEGVRNSSYLAFDPKRKFLYCVNEFKEFEGKASGAVSAFRIDQKTGGLTFLNMKASHGTDPCHLIVDKTGRNVLIANFASGSVCVLPIKRDGSLKDASCVIQHEGSSIDPKRQAGPHAHAVEIDADNRFVFVPELGADKVMHLRARRRARHAHAEQAPALRQGGARRRPAPARHASERKIRLPHQRAELDDDRLSLRCEEGHARPSCRPCRLCRQDFHAYSSCAEVQIAPSGKFLYGSNRGDDFIVIYAIDPKKGTLTLVGHESTRGRIPRNFEIHPSGEFLAAANQDTNNVIMFRIDQKTGKLTPTGNVVEAGTPICVRFM